MSRLRVFISSTPGELTPEQDAVAAAVRTLRLTPVRHELGGHGASGGSPAALVDESDVFVGIYWENYGWVAPGTTLSAIEEELDRSRDRPRLIYAKEPAPERDPVLRALLQRLKNDSVTSYRTFGAPGELSELVLDDLAVLLTERFHERRGEPRVLPDGTVTFVFVDMEGSTRLAREHAASLPAILDQFQSTLATAVARHDGVVVDTEGDGAFCAFTSVDAAAAACVEAVCELEASSWPEDALVRARIGIHTGVAKRTADNYVGLEVHRAARIGAAANGGQILVSRAAAKLMGLQALEGWGFTDLGAFALKGLDRAEDLLQLVAPGLADEIQPPRARGARSVHLPTQLTGLVGREQDVGAAAGLLERHDVRLVTLTGPGGIGKTRLGVAAAARAADAYPDGVYFVALADTRTTDQVVGAVFGTLGLRSEGSRALLSTIEDRLSSGRVLLVLDNFEQVVEARTVVAELLDSCPGLDFVVTSRTPLRIRGETEFPVPPLAVPAAVGLFMERASVPRPDWVPSEAELAAVESICARLDGLPLAIELAAARMRVLDPPALLERLGRKLDVVGGSVPDLPERQRTLTATIEWSFDLLDNAERRLLTRLAVFTGGWTLEAAEAVCGGEGVPDVLSGLERLSEHSLLVKEQGSIGNPRMRMLETIREFAAARLAASEESAELCERHATYFETLIVELRSQVAGETAPAAMARLDDDWDDVLACMDWRFGRGQYAELVQLVSRTWRYVWLRDRGRESTTWMPEVYAARETLEPALRGELCRLWGSLCYQTGRFDVAREAIDEAVQLLAEHGPVDREAWARTLLGGLLPYFDDDLSRSYAEVSRAVELFRAGENLFGLGTSLGMLGTIATLRGDIDEAGEELEEAIAVSERLGLVELVGANHTLRALGHLACGEIESAHRELDIASGTTLYLEGTAYCLESFAAVLLAEGDPARAATALGAAEGLRERTGIQMWPIMRMILAERLAELESAGPEAQAARFAGRQMSPADALAVLRSA